MHLYEIATDIESVLVSADGELTDEQCAALDKLEMNFAVKAENIAKFIRGKEAEAKAYTAEAKRLSEKAAACTNKSNGLKRYLKQCMDGLGMQTVKGELFKISIQKNNPFAYVVDPTLIPSQFFITADPALDKKRMLEFMKAGHNVPGARIDRTESIRIR